MKPKTFMASLSRCVVKAKNAYTRFLPRACMSGIRKIYAVVYPFIESPKKMGPPDAAD
jgi:hypothetical protein